ncbi:hypothetical protein GCM10011345_07390 [Gemmobacter megaterium]|nr:hypothetical protein GCM10011345_07390 [Gemmobacter megaterium]
MAQTDGLRLKFGLRLAEDFTCRNREGIKQRACWSQTFDMVRSCGRIARPPAIVPDRTVTRETGGESARA